MEQSSQQSGIADRRRLTYAIDTLYRNLESIREARAKDPSMIDVAGGDTGLLTKKVRSAITSGGRKTYAEYPLDGVLLKAIVHAMEMMGRANGLFKKIPERHISRLSDLSREEIQALTFDLQKTYGFGLVEEPPPSRKHELPKAFAVMPKGDKPALRGAEPKKDGGPTDLPESLDPAA